MSHCFMDKLEKEFENGPRVRSPILFNSRDASLFPVFNRNDKIMTVARESSMGIPIVFFFSSTRVLEARKK